LVRQLSVEFPRWVIWKNADAAFAGSGDIDSTAPMADWTRILDRFRAWAAQAPLDPVVVCTHPPRTMFLLAVDREEGTFAELDVLARKYFRGWTLFTAEDLLPLTRMDARGFRVVRPGGQGLILLLFNGARWGGRSDSAGQKVRHVPELLAEDRQGVQKAAQQFGLPLRSVRRLADSVVAGSWDRRAMLEIERSAILRAFTEPNILARRIRFKLIVKRACPVLRSVFFDDRRIPGDVDGWISDVGQTHAVYWRNGQHG
jgi:hypothetical protein